MITTMPYGGWPNTVKLTNGNIELIVTLDVGPRVIRFGFSEEPNDDERVHGADGRKWGVRSG